MTEPLHPVLAAAWDDLQAIAHEKEQRFWELFDPIWVRVRDNLPPELDADASLQALVVWAYQLGHGDNLDGWV